MSQGHTVMFSPAWEGTVMDTLQEMFLILILQVLRECRLYLSSRMVPWRTVGHLYMECLSRVLFEEHLRALFLKQRTSISLRGWCLEIEVGM